jgi:hypothetical protein
MKRAIHLAIFAVLAGLLAAEPSLAIVSNWQCISDCRRSAAGCGKCDGMAGASEATGTVAGAEGVGCAGAGRSHSECIGILSVGVGFAVAGDQTPNLAVPILVSGESIVAATWYAGPRVQPIHDIGQPARYVRYHEFRI